MLLTILDVRGFCFQKTKDTKLFSTTVDVCTTIHSRLKHSVKIEKNGTGLYIPSVVRQAISKNYLQLTQRTILPLYYVAVFRVLL